MKRPPPVSSSDPHILYDSCVNNITSPSMYIVFERDQCYPQYLITFVQNKYLKEPTLNYENRHFSRIETAQSLAISKIKQKTKLKPRRSAQNMEQDFDPSRMDEDRIYLRRHQKESSSRRSLLHSTLRKSVCDQRTPSHTSSITTTTSRTMTPSLTTSTSFNGNTQPKQRVNSNPSTTAHHHRQSSSYYNSPSVFSPPQHVADQSNSSAGNTRISNNYQQQQQYQQQRQHYLQQQQQRQQQQQQKKSKCVIS